MNIFGQLYRVCTFGESHGKALGVTIDGFPAGFALDIQHIQNELARRRPGQSAIVTQRKEADQLEIISGLIDGKTTGAPLTFLVWNKDAKSKDYDHLSDKYRPSHADYTYQIKYGTRDHRGGGRSSARETLSRVIAGAIAKQYLQNFGVIIKAYTSQVGNLVLDQNYQLLDFDNIEKNLVRCPDLLMAEKMEALIRQVRKEGDTIGGVVSAVITGTPIGLGEPVFDKLHSVLAQAMMSINAAKGFDYGSGFRGVSMRGSEHNDILYNDNGTVRTKTNHSGGVQGGISNGEDIYFRVAFKPVATLMRAQESLDHDQKSVMIEGKGRHDPCVVPRAVVIVEAMAAMVLMDFYLRWKAYQ